MLWQFFVISEPEIVVAITSQQRMLEEHIVSRNVTDKNVLISALTHHVSDLAEKLRNDHSVASRITVIAQASRFGDFSHRTGSVSSVLEFSTHNTFSLIHEVLRLLDTMYDPEIPYKKAGIVLSGIVPESLTTESLFNECVHEEKTEKLDSVMDALNMKYGTHMVRMGVTLGVKKWQGTQELMSKEYTTKWHEIPSIKAI